MSRMLVESVEAAIEDYVQACWHTQQRAIEADGSACVVPLEGVLKAVATAIYRSQQQASSGPDPMNDPSYLSSAALFLPPPHILHFLVRRAVAALQSRLLGEASTLEHTAAGATVGFGIAMPISPLSCVRPVQRRVLGGASALHNAKATDALVGGSGFLRVSLCLTSVLAAAPSDVYPATEALQCPGCGRMHHRALPPRDGGQGLGDAALYLSLDPLGQRYQHHAKQCHACGAALPITRGPKSQWMRLVRGFCCLTERSDDCYAHAAGRGASAQHLTPSSSTRHTPTPSPGRASNESGNPWLRDEGSGGFPRHSGAITGAPHTSDITGVVGRWQAHAADSGRLFALAEASTQPYARRETEGPFVAALTADAAARLRVGDMMEATGYFVVVPPSPTPDRATGGASRPTSIFVVTHASAAQAPVTVQALSMAPPASHPCSGSGVLRVRCGVMCSVRHAADATRLCAYTAAAAHDVPRLPALGEVLFSLVEGNDTYGGGSASGLRPKEWSPMAVEPSPLSALQTLAGAFCPVLVGIDHQRRLLSLLAVVIARSEVRPSALVAVYRRREGAATSPHYHSAENYSDICDAEEDAATSSLLHGVEGSGHRLTGNSRVIVAILGSARTGKSTLSKAFSSFCAYCLQLTSARVAPWGPLQEEQAEGLENESTPLLARRRLESVLTCVESYNRNQSLTQRALSSKKHLVLTSEAAATSDLPVHVCIPLPAIHSDHHNRQVAVATAVAAAASSSTSQSGSRQPCGSSIFGGRESQRQHGASLRDGSSPGNGAWGHGEESLTDQFAVPPVLLREAVFGAVAQSAVVAKAVSDGRAEATRRGQALDALYLSEVPPRDVSAHIEMTDPSLAPLLPLVTELVVARAALDLCGCWSARMYFSPTDDRQVDASPPLTQHINTIAPSHVSDVLEIMRGIDAAKLAHHLEETTHAAAHHGGGGPKRGRGDTRPPTGLGKKAIASRMLVQLRSAGAQSGRRQFPLQELEACFQRACGPHAAMAAASFGEVLTSLNRDGLLIKSSVNSYTLT